ncbi:MAG TPA: hypothetical protein VFH50_04025 [Acidimicrobiales bacterium]|nr:hypothetical protein [Acidimicrobiales bacterium]
MGEVTASGPSAELAALIGLLDESELIVITALAVTEGLLPETTLVAVLGWPAERFDASVRVLEDLGLVRQRPDGRRTVSHALISGQLRRLCPPDRARPLLVAVAQALRARDATEGRCSS